MVLSKWERIWGWGSLVIQLLREGILFHQWEQLFLLPAYVPQVRGDPADAIDDIGQGTTK